MFIQVMQGEIKDLEAARTVMDRWGEELAPGADGWLGGTYGQADDGQFIAVVRFESEEAARRNSDRPEQGAWWGDMAAHFVGDVTFHDYPEVVVMGPGGSDDAGFVQVIQGYMDHPDQARAFAEASEAMLAETRPDILGATIGIAADGHFTQTVAFRSEAEAREGEMAAMPIEARRFMEELRDLTFIDLRNPWFESG
jgi:hypothetical protein